MIFAQCLQSLGTAQNLPAALFLGGLAGGFTHCAGMCSPFILAQTGADITLKKPGKAMLLPYHLGRMTTYVVLAILVHQVVNLAFVFSGLKAIISVPILLLAALLFLTSAFPKLLNIFPWVTNLQYGKVFQNLVRLSQKFMDKTGLVSRYLLGVLLGFMPCGLLISALLAVSVASNTLTAALSMMAFTAGTVPSLILVAFGGGFIKKRYPGFSDRFSKSAMVLSSIWLLILAGSMVF